MESLQLEATDKSPEVKLNSEDGKILIHGISDLEDALAFYFPIIQWIDTYINHPATHTEVVFEFKYYNTASAKSIYEILKRLAEIHKSGNSIKLRWFYAQGDEHLLSEIENFSDISHLPIQAIEK
ncbi:hypothetical protein OKW21_002455 [Catalinimonas alkaloidigena]|uniref:DUF1987 domain-containing protein n=1 Tax=Catalinimonas alkaloidigena TaxID=1075417 RepID=UPI002404B8C8|nr:DUF1987 domain-containing protein [Catalinimonas alkaloidigena]MDF9797192.1 hypothetical protein [Catalinimonas alkaloidigena]